MTSNDFLRPLSDELDLESLRFPGEETIRKQIERRPAAIEVIRRWCHRETCPAVPKEAHRESFVASPAAAPGLAQLARMLETILGLEARPEIIVFPSSSLYIGSDVSKPESPLRVLASSAVFERMGVREAMFQIGRKLAWQSFEHVPFLGDPTAGNAKPDSDSLMIRGLWKFQELTADRIGLLCCQEVDLATRSILRFASGLPDELLQIDWEALLAERIPEEDAMLADSPYQFALLRAAALRQFALEERYGECFAPQWKAIESGIEPCTVSVQTPQDSVVEAFVVEAESQPLDQVVDVLDEVTHSEPVVADATAPIVEEEPIIVPFVATSERIRSATEFKGSEESEALREFTLWGVLWVVGVDSPISDLARAELWEYFGSEAAAAIDEAENRDGDERCARRCAAAAPIAAKAAFELRRGALEDVIHLALSAGPITSVERDRLADLAELLDLSPEDVEQAAAEVIDPEFAGYRFTEGEDVEAKFDDEWMSGVVHSIDSSGGVRVYFPGLAQTYSLHPTSDLLRPLNSAMSPHQK